MNWKLIALVLALVLLVGCMPAATTVPELSRREGSDMPLSSRELGRIAATPETAAIRTQLFDYAFEHADEVPTLPTGTQEALLEQLREKNVDGVLIRAHTLPPSEAGLSVHALGHDAIQLMTHEDNPVQGLTMDELRAVLRGEIRDWSALGGQPGRIRVGNPYVIDEADFYAWSGLGPSEKLAVEPKAMLPPDPERPLIHLSEGPDFGIGFVLRSQYEFALTTTSLYTAADPMIILHLDGQRLRQEEGMNPDYPLFRSVALIAREGDRGMADFAAYLREPLDLVIRLNNGFQSGFKLIGAD